VIPDGLACCAAVCGDPSGCIMVRRASHCNIKKGSQS
jgi:hypothetical protein